VLRTHPADAIELATILADHRNDLTEAAIGLRPAIGDVLAALDVVPGRLLARMSGSGATCFALFATDDAAQVAAAAIGAAYPDWWTIATRLNGG
jgi:4-diphosphocytidyl-2-C-methyl-D-erythritol kinase